MTAFRRLIAQRHLAVLLCAAALVLRLLVPTGYMLASDSGRVTVTICSGTEPRTMTIAMPGMPDKPAEHGKAELPCAFSGLSAAMLGAIDAVQVAALIAFIIATGYVGVLPPVPGRPAYLRPPLRGPPAHR